jgi:hypothetical protein
LRATRVGTTVPERLDIGRLSPQLYDDQRIVGLAPPFARSDRVDGSGGALFDRCATACRRVAQSRIWSTVLPLVQRSAWGVRPLRANVTERIDNAFSDETVTQNLGYYQVPGYY